MKLTSKLFDSIRIKPRREEKPAEATIKCDWDGCEAPGTHRAPKPSKGKGGEVEYHNFCMAHVRQYNASYNFFAGMEKAELEEALHSPPKAEARSSFGIGQSGARVAKAARDAGVRPGDRYGDPFGVFARVRLRQGNAGPVAERVKPLHEQDRQALEILGFSGHTKPEDIKDAYKGLVKIHHPDANGGDKSSEDRLRAIIAAYSHLKKAGFVGK